MPARDFPNLGLKGGYDEHESGWADDMNVNLLKLSALAQATVKSKVNATPGSPVTGDVYLFSGTHPTQPNVVAIYEGAPLDEAWTYVTPKEGWLVYNQAANYYEKFDGAAWAELATGGGGGGGGDGIPDAPEDGKLYGRKDAAWEEIISGGGGGGDTSGGRLFTVGGSFHYLDNGTLVYSDLVGCSISRQSAGKYTITFDEPMPDTQYGFLGGGKWATDEAGLSTGPNVTINRGASNPITVDALQIVAQESQGTSSYDARISFAIFESAAELTKNVGAGNGGGALSMRTLLRRAAAQWCEDNGQLGVDGAVDVDAIIRGDVIGLHLTRYARGNGYVEATNARFTVPAGKVAYVIEAYPSQNVRTDPGYYKHRLFNITQNVSILQGNSGDIMPSGNVERDYNTTVSNNYDPMIKAGVAGDVIAASAAGGSDSICRTVMCDYVVILLDA